MTTLHRLTTGGEENLVTEEFLTTDLTYEEDQVKPFREKTSYDANLEALGRVLDHVMEDPGDRFEDDRSDLDAAVAPAVREFIDIPHRAAGDERIWHYLAIVWRPDYVKHRWSLDRGNTSKQSLRQKFTKSTRDLYAPAFARLWFMADFTSANGDYGPTEKILRRQYAANRLFDRTDLRQRPVVAALAEVAYELDDDKFIDDDQVFETVAKSVSHELTTISAESVGKDGMKKLINQKYNKIT
jgi:hypothetical protein